MANRDSAKKKTWWIHLHYAGGHKDELRKQLEGVGWLKVAKLINVYQACFTEDQFTAQTDEAKRIADNCRKPGVGTELTFFVTQVRRYNDIGDPAEDIVKLFLELPGQ